MIYNDSTAGSRGQQHERLAGSTPQQSVLPVARLSTNQQFMVELEYRQLTFTSAPEQQHYQAENNDTSVLTVARRQTGLTVSAVTQYYLCVWDEEEDGKIINAGELNQI